MSANPSSTSITSVVGNGILRGCRRHPHAPLGARFCLPPPPARAQPVSAILTPEGSLIFRIIHRDNLP